MVCLGYTRGGLVGSRVDSLCVRLEVWGGLVVCPVTGEVCGALVTGKTRRQWCGRGLVTSLQRGSDQQQQQAAFEAGFCGWGFQPAATASSL